MESPVVDKLNISAKNVTISFDEQLVAYGSLYIMAVISIVVGSIRSVWFVKDHIETGKKIQTSIRTKEAKRFPLTASAVLFGLYVFFKYGDTIKKEIKERLLGSNSTYIANSTINRTGLIGTIVTALPELSKDNVMWLLLVLLCWEGSFALGHLLKPFISAILSRLPMNGEKEPKLNLPYQFMFTKEKDEETITVINWKFDTHDIVSVAICSLVGISHVVKLNWISNNLIGVAFSMYGIEELHLASFKAGCWLLVGLFVYDVFWVFATEVMTTVATGVTAPILLQFPQDLFQLGWQSKKFAMLGLGDIVIPGIFVALLRRFDARIISEPSSTEEEKTTDAKSAPLTCTYFAVTMTAYAVGLVLTILVMHHFKAAQPALLYLVPLCVGVPIVTAWIRGELTELWNYSEDHLVQQAETQEDNEKKTN